MNIDTHPFSSEPTPFARHDKISKEQEITGMSVNGQIAYRPQEFSFNYRGSPAIAKPGDKILVSGREAVYVGVTASHTPVVLYEKSGLHETVSQINFKDGTVDLVLAA